MRYRYQLSPSRPIDGAYRQAGILALVGPRPRRSLRTTLWLSSLHGTTDRGWLLLRDGEHRKAGDVSTRKDLSLNYFCSRPVVNADYPLLEKLAEVVIKDRQKFERLVVSKEKLLEMFGVRADRVYYGVIFTRSFASTINTRNISLKLKSRTGLPLPCTVAGP